MIKLTPEGIGDYIVEQGEPESELLQELARETRERTNRAQMLVGRHEGALLRMLVRLIGARRILELGTFTGYSALWMAEGLPPDGRLITCDINAKVTAIAKTYWARSPHGSKIELRLGPAAETIRGLCGPFDFVFIDADKEGYISYWQLCVPLVRPGGLLTVDNVLWGGQVLAPNEAGAASVAAFNQHVARDPRVERVVLPVRDGVLVARKRERTNNRA